MQKKVKLGAKFNGVGDRFADQGITKYDRWERGKNDINQLL